MSYTVPPEIVELQDQIQNLIQRYWELVKPTSEEVEEALLRLRDDPLNDIYDITDPDVDTGRILICDEVICQREQEEEG